MSATYTDERRQNNPPSPSMWDVPADGRVIGLIDRFWKKVAFAEGDACWLWTGERRSNGYGCFETSIGNRRVRFRTHRFAWEANHGPIEGGKLVLHKCDVKLCCRPDHLWLGTSRENVHDMMRKGRSNKAMLTADEVREIRGRLDAGEGKTAIGKEFNVKPGMVTAIRRGKSYAWVE